MPEKYGKHIEIIAEIGINHQGNLNTALEMIEVAAGCGVDLVKFQKRHWQSYREDPRWSNTFQQEMSIREHRKRLEFDEAGYIAIGDKTCEMERKTLLKGWFASVYDFESLAFLAFAVNACGSVTRWKIASAVAATNLPLAVAIAEQPGRCYLSLGMMDWERVDEVVEVCAKVNDDLVLMHCAGEYPCPDERVNLHMIPVLQLRYGLPVGYSGHDKGVPASVAAVALGAVAVEKHFTLDRSLPGSDHAASLEPAGLETLVRHIRSLEVMLGDGQRTVSEEEQQKLRRLLK